MLVIRLQRTGRRNAPTYRMVVAEHTMPVKGRSKETVGHYLPTREPDHLEVNEERISYWISHGATPSNTVARLLTKNGMKGMEKFIDSYTKKKSKKAEEEAPKEEASAPAADAADASGDKEEEAPSEKEDAPVEAQPEETPSEEAKAEEKADEEPKDEPKAEEKPKEEPKEDPAPKEEETPADEGDNEKKE